MTPPHHNPMRAVTLEAAGLTLRGFSVSGLATWLTVPELNVVFDLGVCPLDAVAMDQVMVTHMHADHMQGLSRHWQLRAMMNHRPAVYYVPESAIDGLREIAAIEGRMRGEAPAEPDLRALPLTRTKLPRTKGGWAYAFPVRHRALSMGYTVGRTTHRLRPEFEGMPGQKLAELRKTTVISDAVDTPLVTFIGDCDAQTLTEQAHIWDSRVLVLECTYVAHDDLGRAARHTHTHLDEIADVLRANDAPAVEALVLKHFSMKSGPAEVRDRVAAAVPKAWRGRVKLLLG